MKIIELYDEFSIKLSNEMVWDKEMFQALFDEMKVYCKTSEAEQLIDREIAAIFWKASWWVKQQIDGVNGFEGDYYENTLVNLDHLAHYLFSGESRADNEYEPI